MVDGNRRDERKTYGLWLNPSGNAVEALQKAWSLELPWVRPVLCVGELMALSWHRATPSINIVSLAKWSDDVVRIMLASSELCNAELDSSDARSVIPL